MMMKISGASILASGILLLVVAGHSDAGAVGIANDSIVERCADGEPYVAVVTYPRTIKEIPTRLFATTDTGNNDPTDLIKLTEDELGSIYGLAFHAESRTLYAGSYHKMRVPFGIGGPGAIYSIDLPTGRSETWASLNAGPDRHGDAPPGMRIIDDMLAMPWVGKSSLGDIELSDDGEFVFVVNQFDNRIYSLRRSDGRIAGAFDHGATSRSWAENARLLGLGYFEGRLFHGVVNSLYDASLDGSLEAQIYRSKWDGTEMHLVASFDLEYPRLHQWSSWTDGNHLFDSVNAVRFPQPLISDISFESNGDMIIGMRSRQEDIAGSGLGAGDILQATRDGPDAWNVVTDRGHYIDSVLIESEGATLENASWGTLASIPADQFTTVATTMYAPLGRHLESGVVWLSTESGGRRGPFDAAEVVESDEHPGLGDVESICDRWIPTPVPSSTPTASLTPTSTSSATRSDIPTPSPTESRFAVYLPFLISDDCKASRIGVDVLMVLDASSSMLRTTSRQRSKLSAVVESTQYFLDQLLAQDNSFGGRVEVGIVGFNDSAWKAADLTDSLVECREATTRLHDRVTQGTRLDLAIELGTTMLSEARESERQQVLILLTDGLPNQVPTPEPSGSQEEVVEALARSAREQGIEIFAIGVGRRDASDPADRINPELLQMICGTPLNYFETPDAEQLPQIFKEISHDLECPSIRDAIP